MSNDNNDKRMSRVERYDKRTSGNYVDSKIEKNRSSRTNLNKHQINNDGPFVSEHHPIRNTFFALIGFFIIVFGLFGNRIYNNFKSSSNIMFDSSSTNLQARNVNKLIKEKKPISFLLMGTDVGALGRNSKAWGGGRTDSMMVVTVNPKNRTTTMISIPRDTLVAISGHENKFPSKINAAHYYGGNKSSIKTVEKMFNIPVDFYVILNMGGLKKMINRVGGVNIVSPLTFTYENQHFTRGKKMHVDGNQALKFTRMRYQDPESDYGRTLRQRIVITALLKKSTKLNTLLNSSFLKSMAKQSKTNMSFDDMLSIANYYQSATKHIVSDHAQGVSYNIKGQDFEVVPQNEKQRVTNEIRKQLGLKHEKTGPRFANKVPEDLLIYAPSKHFGEKKVKKGSIWGKDTNSISKYDKAYHNGHDSQLNPNYDANNTDTDSDY